MRLCTASLTLRLSIFRPEPGLSCQFSSPLWHGLRLSVHHKLDDWGKIGPAQLSRLPVFVAMSLLSLRLKSTVNTASLTLSPPPSGRLPGKQTTSSEHSCQPRRKDRTHQAASVASKHSQQHQLCLGPPTPLNLENQADFSRQQSTPDTWNRRT